MARTVPGSTHELYGRMGDSDYVTAHEHPECDGRCLTILHGGYHSRRCPRFGGHYDRGGVREVWVRCLSVEEGVARALMED